MAKDPTFEVRLRACGVHDLGFWGLRFRAYGLGLSSHCRMYCIDALAVCAKSSCLGRAHDKDVLAACACMSLCGSRGRSFGPCDIVM